MRGVQFYIIVIIYPRWVNPLSHDNKGQGILQVDANMEYSQSKIPALYGRERNEYYLSPLKEPQAGCASC